MRIQHNIAALNAHGKLMANNNAVSKNLEKLSSGYRINRAGDDAAGLAISEKMRGQIRGLNQAKANAEDGISLVQTAEGALNETHSILQRIRELAVQSANGTYQNEPDRTNLQKEVQALLDEIDRIAKSTHFNKINLLNGDQSQNPAAPDAGSVDVAGLTFGNLADDLEIEIVVNSSATDNLTANFASGKLTLTVKDTAVVSVGDIETALDAFDELKDVTVTGTWDVSAGLTATYTKPAAAAAGGLVFQIGANTSDDEKVTLYIDDMSTTGLEIATLSIADATAAGNAIDAIDAAINKVSGTRAALGALQNRLEHTATNLSTTSENLTAAESRIRDVDMAKEMMEMTKNNILAQAAQAMLAQANTQPQNVLQLLQ